MIFEELIGNISSNKFWHCNDEYSKRLVKKQITKKIIDYFIEVDYKKILDVIDEYYQICIEFSEYKEAIMILKYTRELCELEENKDEKILLLINLSIAYSYFYAYDEKKLCYI